MSIKISTRPTQKIGLGKDAFVPSSPRSGNVGVASPKPHDLRDGASPSFYFKQAVFWKSSHKKSGKIINVHGIMISSCGLTSSCFSSALFFPACRSTTSCTPSPTSGTPCSHASGLRGRQSHACGRSRIDTWQRNRHQVKETAKKNEWRTLPSKELVACRPSE